MNRLTGADYSNGMYYHYEYDAVGNRLQQVSAFLADPVTTAYNTYDDANRLSTVAGQTYSFDANGNLLSDGTYTYTYDTANRLVGVATVATTVTYRYNGLGNRLQQSSNGVDTNYTLELNSGLSQVLADGTNTYLYGMNRIGMSNTTGNYLYEYDALGSVRQMENIAGLTLAESYDPYGNVILSSGQAGIYGYSGEEQSANGLVYLKARTYQPFTGAFTSRDTWGGDSNLPMSYNRWMYVYGNPVNYSDPTGMWRDDPPSIEQQLERRSKYPEDYDPGEPLPSISWSPSVRVNLATNFAIDTEESQYYPIDENGQQIEGDFGPYLCGIISLEMILETGTNSLFQLKSMLEKLGNEKGNNSTLVDNLPTYVLSTFPEGQGWSISTYKYSVRTDYKRDIPYEVNKNPQKIYLSHNWYGSNSGSNVFSSFSEWLGSGYYIMALVSIKASGKGPIRENGSSHWVVVTGISSRWDYGDKKSVNNWVRINNPFSNREEYYPGYYFLKSMENRDFWAANIHK